MENQAMNDMNACMPENTPKKKMTTKEKIGGMIFSLALVALCVCVWIWPDLEHGIDRDGIHGRGYRKAACWMSILWNRPIATISGILGALGILGMFTGNPNKKNKEAASADSKPADSNAIPLENVVVKTAASNEVSYNFDFDALFNAAGNGFYAPLSNLQATRDSIMFGSKA